MIRFGAVDTDNEIVYNNNACKLKINNGNDERGELLLTKSEICWKRGPETGFMIPWEKITVQAITQEPQRCVYFMIDVGWPESVVISNNGAENGNGAVENHEEAENGSEDEGNASECSLQEMTEFHLIPENSDDIDEIYYIMTKFPEVAEDMEDDSDDDFFDGENMDQMNLNEDDERFADAE